MCGSSVPTGSAVRGSAGVGALRCTGRLGACRYRTGLGQIVLERTGPVELVAGLGDVTVDEIAGRADIKTAGAIRIGRIDGAAAIKNSNGDTWIGEITGEGRINAANGEISVDLASSGIVAKTANGNVHLDEVVAGSVVAQTAFGSVGIGVRDGVPAWLDLETKFGHVRNDLGAGRTARAGGGRRRGPRPLLDGRHRDPPLREQHREERAMNTITTKPALEAIGLRKSFDDTVAVDGIDLRVPEGSIFALLGPNGAGKTTTVQILSTVIRADAGEVRVGGTRSRP